MDGWTRRMGYAAYLMMSVLTLATTRTDSFNNRIVTFQFARLRYSGACLDKGKPETGKDMERQAHSTFHLCSASTFHVSAVLIGSLETSGKWMDGSSIAKRHGGHLVDLLGRNPLYSTYL